MAIYSLNHKCIGKSTQDRPFTAAAHVRYITRSRACREVVSQHVPSQSKQAQKWIKAEEEADRRNARICEKVMIALPKELDAEQRVQLVRDFASRVTAGGRVPWLAAIHDKGKDEKNPHCHLVFRDRDLQTGKRVLHMSAGKGERRLLKERGIDAMTTERMREIWEHAANDALALTGHRERIDRRTLKAQCIDRQPTLHEGVKVRQMEQRGVRPESKVVEFPNSATANSRTRQVDYQKIDGGVTRTEHNAQIISLAEKRQEKGLENNERQAKIGQAINSIELYLRKREEARKQKPKVIEGWEPSRRRSHDNEPEPDW